MSDHKAHQSQTHMHEHGPYCGHMTVQHGGHTDYLHSGKLDHVRGSQAETHSLEVNAKNPATCTPSHSCNGHTVDHLHGPSCGHEAVSAFVRRRPWDEFAPTENSVAARRSP